MNVLNFISLLCSGVTALQGNSSLPGLRARYIEESGFDDRAPIIGCTYSSYSNNKPYFATFGNATKTQSGEVKYDRYCVRAGFWPWDKDYADKPTKAYAVYQYDHRANCGTNLFNQSAVQIPAGFDYTFSYTISSGFVNTYSESITETVSTKLSMTEKAQVSGDVYGVKLTGEVSSTQEISASISATVTNTKSYTYSVQYSNSFTYHSTETCWYRYQQRASFNVYCIHSYSIVYAKETKVTIDNGYRNARYTYIPSYVLDEQIIKFVYIDNSSVEGFFKQQFNGLSYEYNDVRNSGVVYF